MDKDHKLRRRKKVYVAFSISILVVLIIVVLAVTVLNAKYAITRVVNAACLKELHPGIIVPKMGIDLNVTIVFDVSVPTLLASNTTLVLPTCTAEDSWLEKQKFQKGRYLLMKQWL